MAEPADLKKLDAEFRAWIQRQPSCISRRFSEWVGGEGRSIAAHIRRAKDSGTGFKPYFRAVPMSYEEHLLQHQHGESYHYSPAWFDAKADAYFERWLETMPLGTREAIDEAQKIRPLGS